MADFEELQPEKLTPINNPSFEYTGLQWQSINRPPPEWDAFVNSLENYRNKKIDDGKDKD